ncbi:MAG: hypothetical protein H7Z40_12495, partial [Phycisphaerae bacterium]|nr:hypothetical protein [Gemmatimonadaceae bacterium]
MTTLRPAQLLLLFFAAACQGGRSDLSAADADASFEATISVDADVLGRSVSRSIVGTNIQWVDGADELVSGWSFGGSASPLAGTGPDAALGHMLAPGLAALAPQMLRAVEELAPGALRFPGGTNADVYHWREGIGPLATRGTGEHVFRKEQQRMVFGTGEFLALANRVGAEPIITVNVPSGTPEEASAWVRAVNVSGLSDPDARTVLSVDTTRTPPGTPRRVHYWEIGNEPYLREDLRPELTLQPAEYAKRATAIIKAMKAVDPTIAVGLPLRLDRLGAAPLVHFPGYAEIVLRQVSAPVDYLALHNAYLPLVYKGGPGGVRPDDEDLFRATMAASRVVEADFAAVRTFWKKLKPAQPLELAVTEYGAMFTLGAELDGYASSLGGALYLADVLRVFANTPELKLAAQWSLNGNGIFGAMTVRGVPRGSYEVMRAYSRAMRGRLARVSVDGPTFDSPAIGVVPAFTDTPVISVLATVDTGGARDAAPLRADSSPAASGTPDRVKRLRLLIQNKDFLREGKLTIRVRTDSLAGSEPTIEQALVLAPATGTKA